MSEPGAVADVEMIGQELDDLGKLRRWCEAWSPRALAALDALVSERERLQQERDEEYARFVETSDLVMERALKAEAEVERLTAQLAATREKNEERREGWWRATRRADALAAQLAEAQQLLAEATAFSSYEALTRARALAVSPGEPERETDLGGTAGAVPGSGEGQA